MIFFWAEELSGYSQPALLVCSALSFQNAYYKISSTISY